MFCNDVSLRGLIELVSCLGCDILNHQKYKMHCVSKAESGLVCLLILNSCAAR